MHAIARTILRSGALLLAMVALLLAGITGGSAAAAPPRAPTGAPKARPAAATLPATTCSLVGSTRTCELWAKTGTISLPGVASLTIWGYADSASGAATLPGPTLIATEGETITVILHNTLAEASSLAFPGQNLPPDTVGATAGGDTTYTFVANDPGTFLYQAGLTASGQRQVALGMFGALIVRPASLPGSAYGTAASSFDDEALLVLSEIDPALNAAPTTFDLGKYAPKYWLINGKAYPDTDPITTSAGNRVLLRYLNGGLEHHSFGVLGMHQTVLATSGQALPFTYRAVAETIPAGSSLDAIVTVPASAPTGAKYALHSASGHLDNNGARTGGMINFGGMLTFLTVGGAPSTGDGPVTSNVALSENPSTGATDVTLSADISDAATGGQTVDAAEYFVDTLGANGAGTPITIATPATTVSVNATLTSAFLATLASGNHTFYVHGRDDLGNWGAVSSVVLNLDTAGPTTSGITLAPNPVGSGAVTIQATGSDTATGGANVDMAEYFIDPVGTPAIGSGAALTLNQIAPTVSLNATIASATISGLTEGNHTIAIRSRDSLGNWGALATATFAIDRSSPAASGVSVAPSPNNGTLTFPGSIPGAVRVDATISDPLVGGANSKITTAEGFIDTVGAPGTGFAFFPSDGLFNSSTEGVYSMIPIGQVYLLSSGPHTIYVRGKDAVGNWGATSTTTLLVDKVVPTVSGASATPNPTGGAASVTLTANATDGETTIAAAEWFIGTDPGLGNGTPMAATDSAFDSASEGLTATVNTNALAAGNHNLSLRARDVAGNWSAVTTVVLVVQPPDLVFADGFESGVFTPWSSTSGAGTRMTITAAAALAGSTRGMQAVITGNTPSYVVDNTPTNEASYHARFYFNPNGTTTGTSQHEIFVGRNSGGTTIFRVQYRRTSAGVYQIRARVLRSGGTTSTSWYTITNASHAIEIAWQSGSSAPFSLYIDGVLKQTLSGLNTNSYKLDSVRLGPSNGLNSSMSGTEYYDEFVSTRNTYIGP